MYLHEKENWTSFVVDYERICPLVAKVRHHQGRLLSLLASSGVVTSDKIRVEALVEDVSKSAEIEGEVFDPEHVRSSLCRRLGLDFQDSGKDVPRVVDGAVSVTLDAVMNADAELTEERLWGWHAALFPTGYSGAQSSTAFPVRSCRTGNGIIPCWNPLDIRMVISRSGSRGSSIA